MQRGGVVLGSGCVGGGGGEDEDVAERGEGMGREERKRDVVLYWMGWDVMGVKCGREGRVAACGVVGT